jgi:hypothetical protein
MPRRYVSKQPAQRTARVPPPRATAAPQTLQRASTSRAGMGFPSVAISGRLAVRAEVRSATGDAGPLDRGAAADAGSPVRWHLPLVLHAAALAMPADVMSRAGTLQLDRAGEHLPDRSAAGRPHPA